jgi:hypothetical protein
VSRRWTKGFDVRQLQIEWNPADSTIEPKPQGDKIAIAGTAPASQDMVESGGGVAGIFPRQELSWDFRTTFPTPLPTAIDQGVISPEDAAPANVAALHQEHAREMLAALRQLDSVLEARRLGVDPKTGRPPASPAARERLDQLFQTEPRRLRHWHQNLLGTYEGVFGFGAAGEFDKAVRAWHAGIEVTGPTIPRKPRNPRSIASGRIVARLPVPKPLPEAVAAGDFGTDEQGRVIQPSPAEVREITANHAEQLVAVMDDLRREGKAEPKELTERYESGIAAYASSFGERAAAQLDAYVRRQARSDHATPTWRSHRSGR